MEKIIAYYCAPALTGIKASNIVSCSKNKFDNIHDVIRSLNLQLNSKDIYFDALCECNKRVLLMVYRKNVLKNTLEIKENREFLTSYGYDDKWNTDEYIIHLKERLKENEFPHEIGIFLGYPLHDIYGYLYKRNDECVLCGEWKVYKNAEEAKKLFKRFDDCRIALTKRVLCGKTLAQVF